MPSKTRKHLPGVPVHVTTRGVGGRAIFLSDSARQLFLRDLLFIKSKIPFLIHAYCLMTNHIHLLLEAINAPLEEALEYVLGRHAKRLNAELGRRGYVFEKRYDDVPCLSEPHYLNAIAYIANNPVRAKMVARAEDWAWSSHRELTGEAENLFLCRSEVLARFGGLESYLEHCARQPRAEAVRLSTGLLGQKLKDDAYVELAGETLVESLAALANECADRTGLALEDIVGPARDRRESTARTLFMRRADELGIPGVAIARFLGRSPASVSRTLRSGEMLSKRVGVS